MTHVPFASGGDFAKLSAGRELGIPLSLLLKGVSEGQNMRNVYATAVPMFVQMRRSLRECEEHELGSSSVSLLSPCLAKKLLEVSLDKSMD